MFSLLVFLKSFIIPTSAFVSQKLSASIKIDFSLLSNANDVCIPLIKFWVFILFIILLSTVHAVLTDQHVRPITTPLISKKSLLLLTIAQHWLLIPTAKCQEYLLDAAAVVCLVEVFRRASCQNSASAHEANGVRACGLLCTFPHEFFTLTRILERTKNNLHFPSIGSKNFFRA